jgi:hypothetical protein
MELHLLTARFVSDNETVEVVKQQLPKTFRTFCDQTRSNVFRIVDHQQLPDGSKAPNGKSFVTIRLRIDGSVESLRGQFASAAQVSASQVGVKVHSTSDMLHFADNLEQDVQHTNAADNQTIVTEAPTFFR